MSKPSRRRQSQGSPAGTPPVIPGAGRPRTPAAPSTSPSGSTRAGRRERARAAYKPSFMERYRTPMVVIAALAGIVLISAFVFASAASPAYACTQVWTPAATPSPAAGESPSLGYVQPDMGRAHRPTGEKVTYTYCPPASGPHYNASGQGPITPRLYGPGDRPRPEGWVHNLEHGALVIIYRGRDGDPGVTEAGQTALRALFDQIPASPVCNILPGTSQGPVIARFDDMATPYAALLWGLVMPLETLDTAQILEFWRTQGETTNPEPLCTPAEGSPAPSVEASPAPSVETSPEPSAAPSVAPSVEASAETSPAASPS